MTCDDCGLHGLPTGVGAFKIREGTLRCIECDQVSLFAGCFDESRGELEAEPVRIVEALTTAVAVGEKKVRVPQVCSACGFVEAPGATRMDQVFERYGRLLCRRCRKKNRAGVSRRRPRRGG